MRVQRLGQGGFGHRHEAAGDRRLACRRGCFGNLLADRLEPDRIPAGREPRPHLLHSPPSPEPPPAQQLLRSERPFTPPPPRPLPPAAQPPPPTPPGPPTPFPGR